MTDAQTFRKIKKVLFVCPFFQKFLMRDNFENFCLYFDLQTYQKQLLSNQNQFSKILIMCKNKTVKKCFIDYSGPSGLVLKKHSNWIFFCPVFFKKIVDRSKDYNFT